MTKRKKAEAIAAQGRVSNCLQHLREMVAEMEAINKAGYELPAGTMDHMLALSGDLGRLRTDIWESYMRATE